ncbi:MAG: hypothetical protein K2N35_03845 [Muribaculaceae bacterium]|nr:hypothetical protein [Muribaculaceae bacterium]
MKFDIVTIGNGLQPSGFGGCKVGNVYIATTLLSSKPYQVLRIPALPMAAPFLTARRAVIRRTC